MGRICRSVPSGRSPPSWVADSRALPIGCSHPRPPMSQSLVVSTTAAAVARSLSNFRGLLGRSVLARCMRPYCSYALSCRWALAGRGWCFACPCGPCRGFGRSALACTCRAPGALSSSGVAFRRSAGGARLGKLAQTGPTSHGCRSCSRLTDNQQTVSCRFHVGFAMIAVV